MVLDAIIYHDYYFEVGTFHVLEGVGLKQIRFIYVTINFDENCEGSSFLSWMV